MHAGKFALTMLLAFSGILGGCYFDSRFNYYVHGSIPEKSEPWRMFSSPEYDKITAELSRPGLELTFFMGAKLKDTKKFGWDSYKVVGSPFPVAIIVNGGRWQGEEKFFGLTLDEKRIFLVRQDERIPARLVFSSINESEGEVQNRYQLEFDTKLLRNDEFQLVIEGLRANNRTITLPVISFKGDRGHFEIGSWTDMFISH